MGLLLLFHEMVHVVQYRLLGVNVFATHYVGGFFAGLSYENIPLERCAFLLGRRFATDAEPFDVEAEVSKWISGNLF